MRAFAELRIRQGEGPSEYPWYVRTYNYLSERNPSDTILYFGCRSRSQDLFFLDDWKEMESKSARVRIAPSRDQVQDRYSITVLSIHPLT
jgi:sulfite reductase alpha subunit-like flavoprotein